MHDDPHALELTFALQLVDAVHDTYSEAADLIARLGKLQADGKIVVAGETSL
jgi:hypothetical protein